MVFTREGKYVSTYKSGVNQPAGIAIDDEGNTFVAEEQTCHSNARRGEKSSSRGGPPGRQQHHLLTIAILNSQHQVIASWEAGGNSTGITIDKEGLIYVCDRSGQCVYKYCIMNQVASINIKIVSLHVDVSNLCY